MSDVPRVSQGDRFPANASFLQIASAVGEEEFPLPFKTLQLEGAWVMQLMKHPTLDFGSGSDLMVVRSSPAPGSTHSMEST